MKKSRRLLLAGAAMSVVAVEPSQVLAQTDGGGEPALLEEVTVTARRREESNQRVPVAITSVSGEALENASIQRVEELRFVAPSLQILSLSFGNAVPGYTVRGQRQLEALATQDPSVVMYFADVPMMRPHGTNGAFFDIANVQVLKGPQGTLFGRNTTGGAVLVNPKRPTNRFEAEIGAGVGNYGAWSAVRLLRLYRCQVRRISLSWRDHITHSRATARRQ